ncbi:hypothetical protein FGG08_005080 [Glutinoglossum americanum]|uniref:Uncharacterized protein n=1 Tax=Glutinoglossum americanum TaxID=1670608 RepID=A0A9P8L1S5_9PEZI|nr:hypothetical protein FGG08_005080 [Glutinoglossum americanum]
MNAIMDAGTSEVSLGSDRCGRGTAAESTPSCMLSLEDFEKDEMALTVHQRFIVDSADRAALPIARDELHALLEKSVLDGIPLLVLGNKSDLEDKLSVDELIEEMDLRAVSHREVSCYGISAKEETNLDAVLQWLIARASR